MSDPHLRIASMESDYEKLSAAYRQEHNELLTIKAENKRLREDIEKFREQRDYYKDQLDRVARAVYPAKKDRFTYSVDFLIEEIRGTQIAIGCMFRGKSGGQERC